MSGGVADAPGGRQRPQREFDFDGDPPYFEAVRAIAAALDDEGLRLSPVIVGGQRVRAVRKGALTRYIVPGARIWAGRLTEVTRGRS